MSYLKTRIRASRLFEAAFILAIVELTRRLHQACEHAYDKQAAGWVLPQNPAQPSTSQRTPFENKVNECTQRLFGVELRSFDPSRRGHTGSFTGYGADAYGSGGSDTEITVVNEVNAYTSSQLRSQSDAARVAAGLQPGDPNRFVMGRTGTTPSGYTPYRNFTASNLTNSRAILATQIHELGNSLRTITGVTMGPNSPAGLGGDTDAGTRLERCVFNGEIDPNGRRHRF